MIRRPRPVLRNLPFPVGKRSLGHLEHCDSRSLNRPQKEFWLLMTARSSLQSGAPFPSRMLNPFRLKVMECSRLIIAEE